MSNYPPGVTGNEWEIAGWPPCGGCGHEEDLHAYDSTEVCEVPDCACERYTPYPVEP